MSQRLKCTSQVSNEEIIEDITKGLESSLNTIEPEQEIDKEPSKSVEDKPAEFGDSSQPTEEAPLPMDSTDLDQDHGPEDETSDSEYIDIVALQDAEVTLTDDEKEERKIITEELKETGNYGFKIGDYKWSLEKYTAGLQTCPLKYTRLRSMLYCNRSAVYMKMEKYAKAIDDCTKALELDDEYLKAYIRRAQSYEATEKFDESLADYKKILELEPSHKEAQKAVVRLPPLIEEKNEKLKTEMLGKLKDLGNMILKPFGLSTENFQMEQDPNTQGYKINFKQ